MNTRQAESAKVIEKVDAWITMLNLVRQLAQEEASAEADDEFISDKIYELIGTATEATRKNETVAASTMRFEHKTGLEVFFTLQLDLSKLGIDDEDGAE